MRTTIRLDDQLLRRAKARAAERGVPLNDFIADAVRAALQKRDSRSEVLDLPTFSGGRLLPGVDLDDSSGLLDTMEGLRMYSPSGSIPHRVADAPESRTPKSKSRRRR